MRVGVVGCGTMGAGLVELCLWAGLDVRVLLADTESVKRATARVDRLVDRAVEKGRLTTQERSEAEFRLSYGCDPGELADRQFVVEAAPERSETKRRLFARLGRVVEDPDAVLASTTSSLSIAELGAAAGRPGQVVGLHFFNPVATMPLVELIRSASTTEATASRAEEFVTGALGKQTIRAADRSGFVVNALLVPYLMAAVRMLESGVADAHAIDQGMVLGCGHPMGPLALLDLIGLDTITAVAREMGERLSEPALDVPPRLDRMVADGLLGRKSGRGFFSYGDSASR